MYTTRICNFEITFFSKMNIFFSVVVCNVIVINVLVLSVLVLSVQSD